MMCFDVCVLAAAIVSETPSGCSRESDGAVAACLPGVRDPMAGRKSRCRVMEGLYENRHRHGVLEAAISNLCAEDGGRKCPGLTVHLYLCRAHCAHVLECGS